MMGYVNARKDITLIILNVNYALNFVKNVILMMNAFNVKMVIYYKMLYVQYLNVLIIIL